MQIYKIIESEKENLKIDTTMQPEKLSDVLLKTYFSTRVTH